jgi:hypothetical protein
MVYVAVSQQCIEHITLHLSIFSRALSSMVGDVHITLHLSIFSRALSSMVLGDAFGH